MKKKVLLAIGMVMMVGCLSACGTKTEETAEATVVEDVEAVDETAEEVADEVTDEAEAEETSEYITYEFETFDGETVVIDETNIISQENDDNPLESALVPAEAEEVAPGRDFVYLADDTYYYVEDAINHLVTTATKGAADADSSAVTEDEIFETDDYSIAYIPGTFEVNEARGNVILNYANSEVQAPGSNEIIITKEEGCTLDDIVTAIVGDGSMDDVSDATLGADMIPVKTLVRTSESPADAALTLVDQVMALQAGEDVITVEIIRTVGQDDETDMTVEGAFTHTLESFVLK